MVAEFAEKNKSLNRKASKAPHRQSSRKTTLNGRGGVEIEMGGERLLLRSFAPPNRQGRLFRRGLFHLRRARAPVSPSLIAES